MSDAQKIQEIINSISEDLYNKVNELISLYIPGGKNIPELSGNNYAPTNYKLKVDGATYTLFDSYTKKDIFNLVTFNTPHTIKGVLEKINNDLEKQKKYYENNPLLKEWESILDSNKTQEELIDFELQAIAKKFVDKIYELIPLYVCRGKNVEGLTAVSFNVYLPKVDMWVYKQKETDTEYSNQVNKFKEYFSHTEKEYIESSYKKINELLEKQKEYHKNNPRLQELKEINSKL